MNKAGVDAAVSRVVTWIRDVNSDSPALNSVVGLSDSEMKQLARLGALLRERLSDHSLESLVAALTPDGEIVVLDEVRAAFDHLIGEDAVVHLADLYASIVTPAKRRPLGTFFTPREYAQAIVDGFASRHDPPGEVVDVGAGVGIFSEIARIKWPNASIQAIDINPLTLGLQAVAIAKLLERSVKLVLMDYRQWLDSNVPSVPTLYLGNPPYTRWQLLDRADRADLLDSADGLVGARANLSTLFLAMTLAKLRPQDSLAMIIPAGWMRAEYGKRLRARLRDAGWRRISLRLADSWRFDQAIVDAVLVEVGPESATLQRIEVSDWSGSERLIVSRTEGEAVFPAPGRTHLLPPGCEDGDTLARYARVTRGTASGANRFFLNTPEKWDALGIPQEFRIPLSRRLRPGVNGTASSLETSEILVLGDYCRGTVESVEAWIAAGERGGLHELYLCSQRKTWFDLSAELKTPDVIISALARETFHVLDNPGRLAITNNLLGLYWSADVVQETKDQLLGWLRSAEGQAMLRSSSSVEANGLYRLSPKTMGMISMGISSIPKMGANREISSLLVSGGKAI